MRLPTLAFALVAGLVSQAAFSASISADLQKVWGQQRGMIKMTADAMAEESFGFKPTPEQRSFGEQVLHIAGANSFLMGFTGTSVELPAVDTSNLATFGIDATSKADILAALDRSFEIGAAALAAFDDDAMLEEVQGPPWVGKVTRAAMVSFIFGHNMDIYGQMAVYLRLEGVTPPLSRR